VSSLDDKLIERKRERDAYDHAPRWLVWLRRRLVGDAFGLLQDIKAQFQTDSGLSLRDAVNRLDEAAKDNRISAALVKRSVDDAILSLQRLAVSVNAGHDTSLRIEESARGVARDLSEAHRRADEHEGSEPGAAADAAAQQTVKEKREGVDLAE
jgi:hypothetical protein